MRVFWIVILCLVIASVLAVVFYSPPTTVDLARTSDGLSDDAAPLVAKDVADVPSKRVPSLSDGEPELLDHKTQSLASQMSEPDQAEPEQAADDVGVESDITLVPELSKPDRVENTAPVADDVVMPLDDQGRVVLNERYSIPGAGSVDDPYQIHWPLLVSAVASYKPKDESDVIPPWLLFLDGSMVEISGFIFLPIIQLETSDVLLMFNQWDGCCIGVPPTPYDSLEVVLKAPINLSQTSARYATARGRLQVDPYIKKGWLIGLYIVEEAVLLLPDM